MRRRTKLAGCVELVDALRPVSNGPWRWLALALLFSPMNATVRGQEQGRGQEQLRGTPWVRHTIDDSSEGADGVRMLDVNGDGLLDITTGWEEGNQVRVYLHPGVDGVRDRWPAVTVGKVGSPEDAVFVDLDGDGGFDVVSSCEGRTRTMFVHWAPRDATRYLDPQAWKTEPIPASVNRTAWMFCLPMDIDGVHGIDLVGGSKNPNAVIGWFRSPKSPRNLADWSWHPLYQASWIMSLEAVDMNGNGKLDILASDRKAGHSGCLWLENPGEERLQINPDAPWKEHRIGELGAEVMFLDYADLDGDGLLDVIVPVSRGPLLWHRRLDASGKNWETFEIAMPDGVGGGKSVRVMDVNADGRQDLVVSCEGASDGKSGVFWLSADRGLTDPHWTAHEISGPEGVKFDLLQLYDVDQDGDLDILTCEERDQLGVFWYENPGTGN